MVRARCAELREPRPVDAVYETQHLPIILNRSDKSSIDGNLSADEWNDLGLDLLTDDFAEILILRPTEGSFNLVVCFDVLRSAIDDLESGFVTSLVVVIPRRHSMMAEQNSLRPRIFLDELLDLQADVESRTLPRNVDDIVAVNL